VEENQNQNQNNSNNLNLNFEKKNNLNPNNLNNNNSNFNSFAIPNNNNVNNNVPPPSAPVGYNSNISFVVSNVHNNIPNNPNNPTPTTTTNTSNTTNATNSNPTNNVPTNPNGSSIVTSPKVKRNNNNNQNGSTIVSSPKVGINNNQNESTIVPSPKVGINNNQNGSTIVPSPKVGNNNQNGSTIVSPPKFTPSSPRPSEDRGSDQYTKMPKNENLVPATGLQSPPQRSFVAPPPPTDFDSFSSYDSSQYQKAVKDDQKGKVPPNQLDFKEVEGNPFYGRLDEIIPPNDAKYTNFDDDKPRPNTQLMQQMLTSSYTTVIEGQSQNFPNLEGFLDKKGEFGMKVFKNRYFVLKEDQMIYYKDKVGRDCEQVLGYLHLPEVTKFDLITNETKIKLVTPKRTWILKSDSYDHSKRWIEAMILHSKFRELKPSKPSILSRKDVQTREGYFERLESNKFSVAYFAVLGGILYYKKSMDEKKEKKICLYRMKLEQFDLYENSFKLMKKDETIEIFRFPDEKEYVIWFNLIFAHILLIEQIIDGLK